MCGIFGSTKIYSGSVVDKKLSLMSSRGPDYSSNINVKDRLILGHTRLAILDLDPRANQPFKYENLIIVYNGEIYNFLEIRKMLEKLGYKFKTNSDTEVICAAYLEFGEKCLDYFNGMFAFVIYDSKRNNLFGARDRLGKKPFFYTLRNNYFEFASQLNVLSYENNFDIDNDSITEYLLWGYVPEPKSIYMQIHKLRAGYKFNYNLEKNIFYDEKYWDLPNQWSQTNPINYADSVDNLDKLLNDAVKIRMISDVPIGVFLSGGIDSSLVAALAQNQSLSRIKTFSIKFNEDSFDESKYAKQVSNHINSDHTEILCDYSEGIEIIKKFSSYYDEPFSDSSAIPSLILAKNTKKYVTVALTGDGGDESFIGYHTYSDLSKKKKLFIIPLFIRYLASLVFRLAPNYKHKLISGGLRLKDINEFHYTFYTGINKSWIKNIPQSYHFKDILYSDKPLLERVTDFDIKTFLNGDSNTKVDKATMSFSLESRAPLMDFRVVEFARNLPTEFKFSNNIQKKILKDILFKYVPKEIFTRPKAGFSVPINFWFRNELKEYVLDNLNPTSLSKIPNLNATLFLKFIEDHMSGKWNHAPKIWRVLVLQEWFERNR